MSSILTSTTNISFGDQEFLNPEAYSLKGGKILILSESLKYCLYDSRTGEVLSKGSIPEVINKND